LNKILNTLAREPRGKRKQGIEHLPNLKREKGKEQNMTYNIQQEKLLATFFLG
jgi:hypothetical protein